MSGKRHLRDLEEVKEYRRTDVEIYPIHENDKKRLKLWAYEWFFHNLDDDNFQHLWEEFWKEMSQAEKWALTTKPSEFWGETWDDPETYALLFLTADDEVIYNLDNLWFPYFYKIHTNEQREQFVKWIKEGTVLENNPPYTLTMRMITTDDPDRQRWTLKKFKRVIGDYTLFPISKKDKALIKEWVEADLDYHLYDRYWEDGEYEEWEEDEAEEYRQRRAEIPEIAERFSKADKWLLTRKPHDWFGYDGEDYGLFLVSGEDVLMYSYKSGEYLWAFVFSEDRNKLLQRVLEGNVLEPELEWLKEKLEKRNQ